MQFFDGKFFVPCNPFRYIEMIVFEVDAKMWCISNINQLASIAIEVWAAWAGFTTFDLQNFKLSTINGTIKAKTHVLYINWHMIAFKMQKYKCNKPMTIWLKQFFATNESVDVKHKSFFWNWHRLFLWCSCYNPLDGKKCCDELLWFDHFVYYMLNYLENFFTTEQPERRFVELLDFLGSIAK